MSSIRRRREAARSKALRSVRLPTTPARSTNVLAGLVQGMPSNVPVSSSRGGRTRWSRMPSILRPRSPGAITSTTAGPTSRNPKSAAALRWETTAPRPQAKVAARRRPLGPIPRRPTAKTPRKMRWRRPSAAARSIPASLKPIAR